MSEKVKNINDKPMIRHCMNCKYRQQRYYSGYCDVKYQSIEFPRLEALLCRHYKQKEGAE